MTEPAEFIANHKFTLSPDGFITNPGKFEGEPIFIPYFWEWVLNGEGESIEVDGVEYDRFLADGAEIDAFGLEPGDYVYVREADNGFVYGYLNLED